MKFSSSGFDDIQQLSEWIAHDPYHKDYLDPLWWLTGNGFLSYCVQDDKGPTMYVRIDQEGDLMRVHCQFASESEVSKKRVIRSFAWGLPKMEYLGRQYKMTGFIYKSNSPLLIRYMEKHFGFQSVGNDDYKLMFEVTT